MPAPLRLALPALVLALTALAFPPGDPITDELDAYWAHLARTVADGDYEAYAAGYHADAVLVSVGSGTSYPIARALAGWKQGFDDTKAGRMTAGVDFRFAARLHDATTAHETGMFRYWYRMEGGERQVLTLHFEALLVKRDGAWLTVMEYQRTPASDEEWDAAG